MLSYDVSHIIVLDAPYEGLVHLQAESFLPGVVQQFSRRRFSLETLRTSGSLAHDNIIYCRVPEGRGLHQSARPLSRDETRSENPLNYRNENGTSTGAILTKAGQAWHATIPYIVMITLEEFWSCIWRTTTKSI